MKLERSAWKLQSSTGAPRLLFISTIGGLPSFGRLEEQDREYV